MKSGNLLFHHVSYPKLLQDVRFKFLMNAQPAPCQFLGHDGRLGHEQYCNSVRDHAHQHQWQDRVVIAGYLECEDYEGERSA